MARLILASASASRRSILAAAGFSFDVVVSEIDESKASGDTASVVLALATEKATAVARTVGDGIVIGCDSLLDLDGTSLGKPTSLDEARENWRRLSGRTARLMTGHCLLDVASMRRARAVVSTEVTFAVPSAPELERYLATGESLGCAGGFTLEGYGSPFVTRVNGDALNVMGVSPATLRVLLAVLGESLGEHWLTGVE